MKLLTTLLSSVALSSLAAEKAPNIILYVVDDLGFKDAGCYGNNVIKTPGIDLLASQGTKFTNAFSTCATCSASRSVILSGLYNHANAHYGHAHAYHHFSTYNWVRSLPNLLSENGYRTTRIGKYHLAPQKTYNFQKVIKVHGKESVIDWANKCRPQIARKSKKPFFLYFCTFEPHRPFRRDGSQKIDPKTLKVPPYLPDTPATREELAHYYMSAERADSGLKRLIEILKETNHWDDTVIIFCSDNGAPFPGAKTNVYEPALHLPFIVRDPSQQKQGTVNNALVNYTSITPTLLDYAGVKEPYKLHGKSFRSILGQENPEGWDTTYASHTFHEITMYYPMRVVREKQYKLIWNIAHQLPYPHAMDLWASKTWTYARENKLKMFGKRPMQQMTYRDNFELYDIINDPDESNNLANQEQFAELLKRMKDKLSKFQKETKDPWHVKWFHE